MYKLSVPLEENMTWTKRYGYTYGPGNVVAVVAPKAINPFWVLENIDPNPDNFPAS